SDEDLSDFGIPADFSVEEGPSDELEDSAIPSGVTEEMPEEIEGLGELPIPEDFTREEEEPESEISDAVPPSDTLEESASPGGDADSGIEAFEVGDEEEFFIDEFSLPEMDEEFEAKRNEESVLEEGIDEEKSGPPLKDIDREILITDTEFKSIQKTLETLPINLKIRVEELIAQAAAESQKLKDLVDLLVKEASAPDIAALVTEITGKKIILPKRFEKKTGDVFEEERKSFGYVLRENILPMLSVIIPSLIVLFFVGIGIYNLYVWFDVQNMYKQGIRYIEEDNYSLGNETFDRAYTRWPDESWYIKYADTFVKRNQYHYAQEKYEDLLDIYWDGNNIAGMGNRDNNGIIAYADFETNIRGNYRKASVLLQYLIFHEPYHKKGLLAAGDNFLEWAQEDERYYEEASNAYAVYQSKYSDDAIKFRYLRYFILKDDIDRVMELKNYFQADKNADINAEIYAQLGGYLIDKNEYTDVRDMLDRARKADSSVPEIHYHLARYFKIMNEPGEEKKALIEAKSLFMKVPPLSFTEKRLRRYIDTYNRLGERYTEEGRTGLAEIEFDDAISIIEDKQSRNILGKYPDCGLVYYNRGSLYYDAKLFDAALAYFGKAQENLYSNPSMNYKTGYVYYRNEDYLNALIEFYKAERGLRNNINVIFAVGNALYFRGDYFAAQGYYQHLLDILQKKMDKIEILRPLEEPEHRSLVNFIMRTYNNLGVTLLKLSDVSKNERKESEGLVYLTKSSEHYDILDRLIENPQTMERDKVTKSLPYLNQRHVLYPQTGYELLIYNDIPLDTETPDIDNLFSTKIEY
ncbi:MAG: hypothetical protein JW881_08700, partial [Spirochaetales bacterium]|nr:hypothetical protein [Spirochaetales bacterium]